MQEQASEEGSKNQTTDTVWAPLGRKISKLQYCAWKKRACLWSKVCYTTR